MFDLQQFAWQHAHKFEVYKQIAQLTNSADT